MTSIFKGALVALIAFAMSLAVLMVAPKASHANSITLVKGISYTLLPSAYAQEAVPTIAPTPAGLPAAGKAGDFLNDLAGKIPSEGVVLTIAVFVYDFARRRFPSKDPASFWRDIKKLLLGIIALLAKIDAFGDKIFGQNTLPPAPPK